MGKRIPGKRSPEAIARIRIKRCALKRRRKLEAIAYKGGCCEHCGGVFDPCVYDFHHLDPTTKVKTAHSFLNLSLDKVKEEVDKCLLLCSNCHRALHYKDYKLGTNASHANRIRQPPRS